MSEQKPEKTEQKQSDGGLYKNLSVSVRLLDAVILAAIAILAGVLIFGISKSGYTVSFNSKGGTDVAPIEAEYQQKVNLTEEPSREGYVFDGWYLDEECTRPADDPLMVEESVKLYAGWKPAD